MVWGNTYIYAYFYNASNTSQRYLLKFDAELNTPTILMNHTDFDDEEVWIDVMQDDSYYVVSYMDNNFASKLYSCDDGGVIASGTAQTKLFFSIDGSYCGGNYFIDADNYVFSTDYIADSGSGSQTPSCTANYSYFTSGMGQTTYKDFTDPYIEWALPSFSDETTVQCVELYVDDKQFNDISYTLTDYTLMLNGQLIGNPDFISQGNDYISWVDIDLEIGSADFIAEFRCIENDNGVYWKDLPLHQQGQGYSHNVAIYYGDGFAGGTPFFSYMDRGLNCHISYDITTEVDECNTYTLTQIAGTNLTAYQDYILDININGNDPTYIDIFNNDTSPPDLIDTTLLFSGNTDYRLEWLVDPYYTVTGNYSTRIYEMGCTTYTWDEWFY
jgi:hypothetical protein